ncbi:hypothetical protein [Pelagibacterium luteolum]|uniref:Uncharacterized protein n=1 Tax=Pelagibacterium luteolum TaxID=440168 RepID=A0A1G7XIS1_9HYPH|nr:hypothetical protein [Pelagibacterium luteolum]SDG84006.1 hypothetical protein SAMN04487974_109140 [Pelagibacterium luteolum]
MHFTDGEAGLALGFQSALRREAAHADAAIEARDAEIVRLRRQLAHASISNRDLIVERGQRNIDLLLEIRARQHRRQ